MDEIDSGSQTPEAPEAPAAPAELPAAEIKKIPWVQAALHAQGQLEKLKAAEKAAAEKAAAEKLASEGRYAEAVAAAEKRAADLEARYTAEMRAAEGRVALLAAGLSDSRAASLFLGDWGRDEPAANWAARVKSAPENALYFQAPARVPAAGPAPAPAGAPQTLTRDTARAQLADSDPAKREVAKKWLRDYYTAGGGQR